MTNLRFNRDTKASASLRNEIVKCDRKSRAQKIDKDKAFASRDSSMLKKLRALALESESQRQSKSQSEPKSQRSVIDLSTVASIVFASIDNATLLRVLLQLLSSSSDANFSSIVSITTFVASVIVSITISQMIEIVDDSDMNDIDVLLEKYDRAQTELLRFDLDAHDQNRVQEKTQIYVNVSSLSSSVSARSFRVASSDITSRTSRISIKRRFKILIVSKTDEFSRDRHAVMNNDDDEESNVKDDNCSNCIDAVVYQLIVVVSRISSATDVLDRRSRVSRYVVSSCVADSLFNSRRFRFVFVWSSINCRTLVSFYASIRYH
jgi:hypothetical protein